MHEGPLDLNLIAVFDALVREQSVTRAADALGLSQSAMSHALRRLRTFFNDPLFVKTAEGMVPTPMAGKLTPSILQIMGTVRSDLLLQAGFDPAKAKRVFSFCMTDMGELVFLPPLIRALRELAPGCSIRTMQLPPKQIFSTLESGDADLALGSIHAIPKGLFQQQLFAHPFVTIVNHENREIGERMTIEQFFKMEHVVVALSGNPDDAYDRPVRDYEVKRKIFLTTPHFLSVPLIIEQYPQLIATVPRELGRIFSNYKAIRVVEAPLSLPRFFLRQHWHPRFQHDEANIWLRKLVKKTFNDYPE
jgi:DNA-binding transcriptional LysR family regulator